MITRIKPIEVVCSRWILSNDTIAITLYPFIFYNGEPDADTKRHEWVHVAQIQRLGWIKFYLLYIWYHFKYGYRDNPFENEAYKN